MQTLFYWSTVVLFMFAVATAIYGLARWSAGGRQHVYAGLVFVVGLGFILLDGVVPDSMRLALVWPSLALLTVWRFRQRRSQRGGRRFA